MRRDDLPNISAAVRYVMLADAYTGAAAEKICRLPLFYHLNSKFLQPPAAARITECWFDDGRCLFDAAAQLTLLSERHSFIARRAILCSLLLRIFA